ncbi:WbqC family protein [Oceanobacillus sp. CAU 1775]
MMIAIHQPNYIPWIGYFHKMAQVDRFMLLDTAIYSKGSYTNRNKIKTAQGPTMLTVPLKTKRVPINEVFINNSQNWRRKHWETIESNYKKSDYWGLYSQLLSEIYQKDWESLSLFNIELILFIRESLQIKTEIVIESEISQEFGIGSERIVNICKYLNADTYLSGQGARKYNNEESFKNNNINLKYQDFNHPEYNQKWNGFEEKMSILDLMFNHGPESLKIIRNS